MRITKIPPWYRKENLVKLLSDHGPSPDVYLEPQHTYALAEYDSPEDAENALRLNGLNGLEIQRCRPSNPAYSFQQHMVDRAQIPSGIVSLVTIRDDIVELQPCRKLVEPNYPLVFADTGGAECSEPGWKAIAQTLEKAESTGKSRRKLRDKERRNKKSHEKNQKTKEKEEEKKRRREDDLQADPNYYDPTANRLVAKPGYPDWWICEPCGGKEFHCNGLEDHVRSNSHQDKKKQVNQEKQNVIYLFASRGSSTPSDLQTTNQNPNSF